MKIISRTRSMATVKIGKDIIKVPMAPVRKRMREKDETVEQAIEAEAKRRLARRGARHLLLNSEIPAPKPTPDDLEDQEKAPGDAQEPATAAKEPDELDEVLKGLEDEDTPPKTPIGDYYDRKINQETKERPYDKWTYPEIRNEIKDRKIKPKSWKTGNLIKNLRKDDKKRSK